MKFFVFFLFFLIFLVGSVSAGMYCQYASSAVATEENQPLGPGPASWATGSPNCTSTCGSTYGDWDQNCGWTKQGWANTSSINLTYATSVYAINLTVIYDSYPSLNTVEAWNGTGWSIIYSGLNNSCPFRIAFTQTSFLTNKLRITTINNDWGVIDAVQLCGNDSGPSWVNVQNNASTVTGIGGVVNWTANLSDDIGVSYAWLEHNSTNRDDGAPKLFNESLFALSGTNFNVSKQVTINVSRGNYSCGRFWFNDSSNNVNVTDWSCFTVQNSVPVMTVFPAVTNASVGHSFTVVSNASDADGGADIVFIPLNVSAGTVVQLDNTTNGLLRGVKYNVSGTALSNVSFNVSFCDSSSCNLSGNYLNRIPNNNPTVTSAILNDSAPVVGGHINCTVSGVSDTDGDGTTVYYSWFRNGLDANNHTQVLTGNNLSASDSWKCLAWVGDGYGFSGNVSSGEVSVGTGFVAPNIFRVNVTTATSGIISDSSNPSRNDSWLNFSVSFTDGNADDLHSLYVCKASDGGSSGCGAGGGWCNSSFNISGSTLSCRYNISSSEASFASYFFVVDNESLVSASNSSTTVSWVLNHPPSVPNITLPVNYTWILYNSVNISFNSTDEDGDSINYSVFWHDTPSAGLLVYNGTYASFNLSGMNESTYYVKVDAVDGHGYSSQFNSTLLWLRFDYNAPTFENVSLSSYSFYTTGTTLVRVNISDNISGIDNSSIVVSVLDFNGLRTNYSLHNASDNVSDFVFTFTPLGTAGTYYVTHVFADDAAGNRNTSFVNASFSTTVYTAPTQQGGGTSTTTEFVEVVKEAEPVTIGCNHNGVCDVGFEDYFTCPEDCPQQGLGDLASFFLCYDRNKPCFWTTKYGWFYRLLFGMMTVSVIFLVGRPLVKKQKFFKQIKYL